MAKIESYFAMSGGERRPTRAAAAVSPFTIEVRFLGGLTPTQQDAFKNAANRWTRAITGDLPAMNVDGELIDDIVILAQGVDIDGPGSILGQAGPTHIRPASAGTAAGLPSKGIMSFDTADLADMEAQGTLGDVITHEMGHVLGVGSIWRLKDLIRGSGTANPVFTGARARAAWGELRGTPAQDVPVENTGGQGTRESHWRELIFRNELMSGFIVASGNPLSKVTVASLADMGYQVDMKAAEPFSLPNLLALAESGELGMERAGTDLGMVLPVIPTVLPEEAMAAGN